MQIDENDVLGLERRFMEAWSSGDLEGISAMYAPDATMAMSGDLFRGRAAILTHYRDLFPDPKAMGTLTLELEDFRSVASVRLNIASAMFQWKLHLADGRVESGYSLIVYGLRENQVVILQDMTK